ncbi:MAG TPA: hypothetical protein VLG50_05385 [Candidatus Saccharimonadales bacterium]|nr:hypothetical protein [Candidatus Saccharimonadales bacterium]
MSATSTITKPINYEAVASVYSKQFAILLKHLKVETILDVNEFVRRSKKHKYPNIASIFLMPGGGSYQFYDNIAGYVSVMNGTLHTINYHEIPFGDEYYLYEFHKPLL